MGLGALWGAVAGDAAVGACSEVADALAGVTVTVVVFSVITTCVLVVVNS